MKTNIGVLVVAAGFAACAPKDSTPIGPADGWVLAWADEFDGAAGSAPDPARWVLETGTGPNQDGWGNSELQTYTTRAENVSLDGAGNLLVTARRESLDGRAYTSGRLKTQGLYSQRYGRFEARIKVPAGKGLWPAFWMLGENITEVSWPKCGEIDVLELRGSAPSIVLSSLHGTGYSGGAAISKKYTLPDDSFDRDFHVFRVDWDPGQISFWVDGQVFQTVTANTLVSARRDWPFQNPFFLLLNVAVGGTFLGPGGQPDANTAFPQTMTVDFVRAYSRVPAP